MSGLKPFSFIPEDISQWGRWFRIQDIPDPVSDTILTGSATFIGTTPKSVTFDTEETSNDYTILIDRAINEDFWVTAKTTTGFRLNSSNATSVASVRWVLVR